MDSEYLQRVVGEALAEALTEVAVKQPADPIEYIGNWLLKHQQNLEHREKVGRAVFCALCFCPAGCLCTVAHALSLTNCGALQMFKEKEQLEQERADYEYTLEQKRLMRLEEERVMRKQALDRARKIEAERVALHTERLDDYVEKKEALEKGMHVLCSANARAAMILLLGLEYASSSSVIVRGL